MKRGNVRNSDHYHYSPFYHIGILCHQCFRPRNLRQESLSAKDPAFEAKDQKGIVQTFESIRGQKGAFLVFYRSADW